MYLFPLRLLFLGIIIMLNRNICAQITRSLFWVLGVIAPWVRIPVLCSFETHFTILFETERLYESPETRWLQRKTGVLTNLRVRIGYPGVKNVYDSPVKSV